MSTPPLINPIRKPAGEPEQGSGFSARTLVIFLAAAILSMTAAFYFLVNERELAPGSSSQPISVEKQALGMRALVDLLQIIDRPATPVSALKHSHRNRRAVILLPSISKSKAIDAALSRYENARAMVFFLPKRVPSIRRRRRRTEPVYAIESRRRIERVLNRISSGTRLVRPERDRPWSERTDYLVQSPTIDQPQLINGDRLKTVLGRQDGAWIASTHKKGNAEIYVVADPDPFLNHGLDDGENAELAVRFLEKLLGKDGLLLIDDTAAGSVSPPSFWRELFRLPLLAFTISAVIAIALVLLRATGQFGARDLGQPALQSGRTTILEACEALISRETNITPVLVRYWHQSLLAAGQQYRVADLHDRSSIAAKLQPIEKERDLTIRAAEIEESLRELGKSGSDAATVVLARKIYGWRKGMLHGHTKVRAV